MSDSPVTMLRVDSPLGSWTHCEWRPAHLAGIVDHMWHFEGRMSLPRERTFPGGYLELVLHLGPRFRDVDARGVSGARFPLFCLAGLHTRPVVIEAPDERCCVMGIRLRPVGAFVLFTRPVSESTDLTLDLTDVAGPTARELAVRCGEVGEPAERFRHVAEWIMARLAKSRGAHRGIAWAAAQLESSHGARAVGELRDRIGLSRTQFAERFREHVGVTPKRYARVLRFRYALTLLQAGSPLSAAALTAGYFDQPHMNADFRDLAGMTPAEFTARSRYPNSPSLPEAPDERLDISPRRRRRTAED